MDNSLEKETYQKLYSDYTAALIKSVENIAALKSKIQTIEAFQLFHFYENVSIDELKKMLADEEANRDLLNQKKSKTETILNNL